MSNDNNYSQGQAIRAVMLTSYIPSNSGMTENYMFENQSLQFMIRKMQKNGFQKYNCEDFLLDISEMSPEECLGFIKENESVN